MKLPLILCVLSVGFAGCSVLQKKESDATANSPAVPQPAPPSATPAPAKPADPVPVNVQQGRIATVRSELKFVVVDFTPGTLPAIGRRMSVYRGAQKVGELLITGPTEGLNIAADLIEGSADAGDSVR